METKIVKFNKMLMDQTFMKVNPIRIKMMEISNKMNIINIRKHHKERKKQFPTNKSMTKSKIKANIFELILNIKNLSLFKQDVFILM